VQDAEAEAVLDADHQKIVEAAGVRPNQCSASVTRLTSAVDGHGRLGEAALQPRPRHVALAETHALPADAAGALDHAGQADADADDLLDARRHRARSGGLPSSTRSKMTSSGWRSSRMAGRASPAGRRGIGHRQVMRWGESFTPTTWAASGLSSSITRGRPRAASRWRLPGG